MLQKPVEISQVTMYIHDYWNVWKKPVVFRPEGRMNCKKKYISPEIIRKIITGVSSLEPVFRNIS